MPMTLDHRATLKRIADHFEILIDVVDQNNDAVTAVMEAQSAGTLHRAELGDVLDYMERIEGLIGDVWDKLITVQRRAMSAAERRADDAQYEGPAAA